MKWSLDDSSLVSCADDGSIYEWDISDDGKRKNELVIKSWLVFTPSCSSQELLLCLSKLYLKDLVHSSHSDITLTSNSSDGELIIYSVGSDRTIKQVGDNWSTYIQSLFLVVSKH